MAFNVNQWYKEICKGDVLFSNVGELSSDQITQILDKIEKKIDKVDDNPKKRKRLYSIIVESLQNLYHHSNNNPLLSEKGKSEKTSIFVLKKSEEGYRLTTGNYIYKEAVQKLGDRIEQINYLSKAELKALYKLILNNEEYSEKGGGGLGMVDIARKSGNKIEYKFYRYNKNFHYFCFSVNV